ncbi:hypothetical protein ABZX51_010135 [Aspergillus tubingensis]
MPGIKTVAIAGASGTLGPHVLKALIDAGFDVTVLARAKKSYDSNVKVLEVDYTSHSSLTAALQGIDAVVSTVSAEAIEGQTILIDAAITAGVKRFIPSDFGTVTTNPKVEGYPLYSSMAKIQKYLREKSAGGDITWTVLGCGAFLDFLLTTSVFLDFAKHTVTLLDDGDNRLSTTSLSTVGKAVAAILTNFEATKNRAVFTSEAIVTQNEWLRYAKELKPGTEWDVTKEQTSAVLAESLEQLAAGDHTMPVILKLLRGTALAGDAYGGAYDVNDNELLGVKELTSDQIKKLIVEKI